VVDGDQAVDLASWVSGIHTFVSAASSTASLGQLISLVASTACKMMGCDFCGVLLLREEDRRLIMEASHGFTFDYAERLNQLFPIELDPERSESSPSTRAFLAGKPIVVNDVACDPQMGQWRQLAAQQGYRSLLSVPLMHQERPFGVINCYHSESNQITDSSVELLGILANQVGWAVEATHLRDLQRANTRRLTEESESLRRQSELLQQAEQIHKGLNQIALSGGGLHDLAAELRTLLMRSVFIDDIHGRLLTDDDSGLTKYRELPQVLLSQRSSQTITANDRSDGRGADWSVTPIFLDGVVVARIWSSGNASDLRELELRALAEAAVIGGIDILRTRTAAEIEWRLHGDIINALLDDQRSQIEVLTERAMQLGHDLSLPYAIIVARMRDVVGTDLGRSRATAVHLVRSALISLPCWSAPGPLTAMRDGHLIIFAPTDDQNPPADLLSQLGETVRETLNRALAPEKIRVAVGDVCHHVTELPRSYRVCRGALAIHALRGAPACTIVCRQLGLLGLLLQIDDPRQLTDFADRPLQLLRDHDSGKGTALVETLNSFFANNCHLERTARQLYVHPNTVRLRLRRAEAVLSVDLSRREAQLDLHTAFLVDEVARTGF